MDWGNCVFKLFGFLVDLYVERFSLKFVLKFLLVFFNLFKIMEVYIMKVICDIEIYYRVSIYVFIGKR